MSTIHDIVRETEESIRENKDREETLRSRIEMAIETAKRNGQTNLDPATDARCEAMFKDIEELKASRRRLNSRLARAREAQAEEVEQEKRFESTTKLVRNKPHYDEVLRIGNESHTYRKAGERSTDSRGQEVSFLTDLFRAQVLGDPSANERLARHGREMSVDNPKLVERAVATGGVPGFIPPAYLTEDFAEYARAGRPLANLCRHAPLPAEGMTVNIPRVTTSSATAIQATENATIGNQDPASTNLVVPVCTVAGYVVLSRQAIERGPMTEEIVFADLSADYNAKLDAQLINGSGSSGQHLGVLGVSAINAITYTDATPTPGAMWPKLADMVGKVMSGRFTGPSQIVMTPTEWAWLLSAKDSQSRPFVEPSGVAMNPVMVSADGPARYAGVAGYLFGIPIVLDGNIPANLGAGTNETRIIAADFRDLILFEDDSAAPAQMRFEQPSGNALGIMLVAYGYSAFASGRQPKAISVMAGTGLITPAL
jgi:HK97 family phage major capsid protein